MLTILRIKNLALVADLTVELGPGYNAITGETGAGKSIILGALNLILGERADRSLIRSGCDSCSVEAVFSLGRLEKELDPFFVENGLEPCEQGQLLLKRVFTIAGSNRQFINGSPATLNVLAELGEHLVDMHGPHDHQSLLQTSRQLEILDAFGKLEETRAVYQNLLKQRLSLLEEKSSLIIDEKSYAQQLDLLTFQVKEIESANLKPDEEITVADAYQRSSNAARLLALAQAALGAVNGEETALLPGLHSLGRTLLDLTRLDPSAKNLAESQGQAVALLQDLESELGSYAEALEIDPASVQELEERFNLIQSLKRKYGSTAREIIAFGQTAREKLEQIQQRDALVEKLQIKLREIEAKLWSCGRELSKRRQALTTKLSQAVVKQLAELGFKQSVFQIEIKSTSGPAKTDQTGNAGLTSSGLDTVEFLFSPNPGEPTRPLRAIASSGEMARVMLAIKTVLAAEDRVPVLVFDEVDANVGGETAHAVGQKMREIGQKRQVLCITHLAPVAAAARSHYLVKKEVKEGRTISQLELLNSQDRVAELARMLGGQGETARKHAESLLLEKR